MGLEYDKIFHIFSINVAKEGMGNWLILTCYITIIIVVIITWTSENLHKKIMLTSQLSGSLIGSNGLILRKILSMMSQLAT